ncbi:MAG: adenosine deaminase [Bdellovibrionales bacterium GWB1_55_8]|nr:MAG: adenosine deaminase [Bdellovibrionales bacterium GWB1_55_8]
MKVELHRHLDISLRLETLLELAQERGLEGQSSSLAGFRDKVVLHSPLQDLDSVLDRFRLLQQVLDRPEVLERVAYETVHDCAREGTTAVELRFSPSFVCELNGLSWNDILDGFESGMRRALRDLPLMQAGLICIASRNYGVDSAARTVEFYLQNRTRFIGLDLAGNEQDFPCRMFEEAFRPAREAGAQVTIHAGEATGPESIWEAIEFLGARRIGHGVSSILDGQLLEYLSEKSICLEMCPTSNWLTRAVKSREEHPLPQLLRAGVPVTINTDDPTIFGVTLPSEFEICRDRMGLTDLEIETCHAHAVRASFLKFSTQ